MPRSVHRRVLTIGAVLALCVSLLIATTAAPSTALPSTAAPSTAASAAPRRTVTLVTGDRVIARTIQGQQPLVTVSAGPGRAHVPIVTLRHGGHVFVEPAGARPASLPGTTAARRLATLGMTAMRIDKGHAATAWQRLAAPGTGRFTTSSGIARLWLDGQRRLLDDGSREQIGVPVAEQLGLTGAGVEVAVLDSGYDATHPDLAGVVNETMGFTDAGPADVNDRFGHGTHVASILAGSGAASGGRDRGVATGAQLAIGKVCGDTGFCDDSAILAGMDWAATQVKARIVNMSFGGADTPDIDPIEDAVNTLTAKTGTLFVVAAGNDGPVTASIESPGSADAALTVGAVDSQDALADFSSRGPTKLDTEIKPDITAPGVHIVAARAAGTTLCANASCGDPADGPIDDRYSSLSGTSMATPHVAGAAALLAQQHPTWQAGELKSALMSSAHPRDDLGPYEQGAGRVDVGEAVTTPVHSAPASVPVATLPFPHDPGQQVTRTYTYVNDGADPQALHLALPGDAPAGLLELSTSQLSVPAHGSGQVAVTVHGAGVPAGRFGGPITASTPDGTVVARTVVAAEVEPESYTLRADALDRDGQPADTPVFALDPETGDFHEMPSDGVRLPAKDYDLFAVVSTGEGADATQAIVVTPFRLAAGSDHATLDARTAQLVDVGVDQPGSVGILDTMVNDTGADGSVLLSADVHTDAGRSYVTPMSATRLGFAVASTWWRGDTTPQRPSPYRYDVATVEPGGGIPARPRYRYRHGELAVVQTTYRGLGATTYADQSRVFDLPGFGSTSYASAYPMLLPATVTDYVSPQVPFLTDFSYGPSVDDRQAAATITIGRPFHAGRQTETYNVAAIGPSFPYERDVRQGNLMGFTRYSFFTDAGPATDLHSGGDARATGTATLARDGTVIATWPYWQTKYIATSLPDEESTCTFTLSANRDVSYTNLSTKVTGVWTFRSALSPAGSAEQFLPLLAVRYSIPGLDEQNRATAGRTMAIPIEVHRNPDHQAVTTRRLAIEASTDDGATWTTVPVTRAGSRWLAVVRNPRAGGFVSLRATAADTDGNAVTETIIHAYAVH